MVKPKIESETKEERFKRIATLRTQRILDDIRLLGNCSNKSSYSYTHNDVLKIFNTLERELKITKEKFKNKNYNRFSL